MANIISKIENKYVQDVSSIHAIIPNVSTFTLRFAHPDSSYVSVKDVSLPSDVLLKETASVLVYKGTRDASATAPGAWMPDASKGWTWKVRTGGYICNVSVEVGDMIICNTHTTATNSSANFDWVQANLDPTTLSKKGHTHAVSQTITSTNNGGFTPTGTISTTVTGKATTFLGSNTPQGTISGTYSTVSTSHSHTFTGTAATLTFSYYKPASLTGNKSATVTGTINSHSYTPAGSVNVTCTSTSTTVSAGGSITQTAHSHSFNGTAKNVTITYDKADSVTGSASPSITGTINDHSYTPAGTVTTPTVNVTAPTSSVNYANGTVGEYGYEEVETTDLAIVNTAFSTNSEELTFVKGKLKYQKLTNVSLNLASFTYVTSVSATATQPTFQGTAATLSHTYNLTASHSHGISTTPTSTSSSYTPAGTLSTISPSITNNVTATYMKVTNVTASFTGTAATLSHSTFSLTAAHTHSVGTASATTTVSYTPAGTIDSKTVSVSGNITGTFYGTAATYAVSGTPLINSATSTFYGDAVASHSHTFDVSTTSGGSSK